MSKVRPEFQPDILKEVVRLVAEQQEEKLRAALKHTSNCDQCFPRFHELMNQIAQHMLFGDTIPQEGNVA